MCTGDETTRAVTVQTFFDLVQYLRVSENQIFLSVIRTDSLVSKPNSISPNKFQDDFHFNKLFNVVLNYVLFKVF